MQIKEIRWKLFKWRLFMLQQHSMCEDIEHNAEFRSTYAPFFLFPHSEKLIHYSDITFTYRTITLAQNHRTNSLPWISMTCRLHIFLSNTLIYQVVYYKTFMYYTFHSITVSLTISSQSMFSLYDKKLRRFEAQTNIQQLSLIYR